MSDVGGVGVARLDEIDSDEMAAVLAAVVVLGRRRVDDPYRRWLETRQKALRRTAYGAAGGADWCRIER